MVGSTRYGRIKSVARRAIGALSPTLWRLRRVPALVVLAYHRVLPVGHPAREYEQPGMWVSPESFERHLAIVAEYFEVVDLGDWLGRVQRGETVPARACAITFDDGWRDNFQYAYPLLCRANVPATIFLVSDRIGGDYSFWPNRLARLLRTGNGLPIQHFPAPIRDKLAAARGSMWSRGEGATVDQIDAAINECKALPDSSIQEMLDAAEAQLAPEVKPFDRELLSESEIVEMSKSGLIRFGSHTRRHVRLLLDVAESDLQDEIRNSQSHLESLLREPIHLFCYPNGDVTERAVALVSQTYSGAVTTVAGWNSAATDRFRLRRISIHEGIASNRLSFLGRLGAFV